MILAVEAIGARDRMGPTGWPQFARVGRNDQVLGFTAGVAISRSSEFHPGHALRYSRHRPEAYVAVGLHLTGAALLASSNSRPQSRER